MRASRNQTTQGDSKPLEEAGKEDEIELKWSNDTESNSKYVWNLFSPLKL